MIYTIGPGRWYAEAMSETADQGRPLKKLGKCELPGSEPYRGGSVWQTKAEAADYLQSQNLVSMRVLGLDADWETDTEQQPGEPFRRLLRDAVIIALDDQPRQTLGIVAASMGKTTAPNVAILTDATAIKSFEEAVASIPVESFHFESMPCAPFSFTKNGATADDKPKQFLLVGNRAGKAAAAAMVAADADSEKKPVLLLPAIRDDTSGLKALFDAVPPPGDIDDGPA